MTTILFRVRDAWIRTHCKRCARHAVAMNSKQNRRFAFTHPAEHANDVRRQSLVRLAFVNRVIRAAGEWS